MPFIHLQTLIFFINPFKKFKLWILTVYFPHTISLLFHQILQ